MLVYVSPVTLTFQHTRFFSTMTISIGGVFFRDITHPERERRGREGRREKAKPSTQARDPQKIHLRARAESGQKREFPPGPGSRANITSGNGEICLTETRVRRN